MSTSAECVAGESDSCSLKFNFDRRLKLQFHGTRLRLVLPTLIAGWSLTSLRDRMIKIGAKAVRHARSIILRLAEVAVACELWAEMLTTIACLAARARSS